MPGKYDPEKRTVILNTELAHEPVLTTATLINRVVCDLLFQNGFAYPHLPEVVDMAVVMTGLGLLQSNIGFVNQGGKFWDSTQWETVPRPFLDRHALSYVAAVAAWIRGDKDPDWANDLPADARKPMRKSLKFLSRTDDCFIKSSSTQSLTGRSPQDWFQEAAGEATTSQIIALRFLECNDANRSQIESLLLKNLNAGDRTMQLHALAAVDRLQLDSDPVIEELRMLVTLRDEEIRAKAMLALARMQQLDERTIDVAASMLDSHARYVVFAGIFALTSLESLPESAIDPVNRGFQRALQACDHDLTNLFTTAWLRWEENPEHHFEELLREDSPEFLELALESLKGVREQLESVG